MPPTVPSTLRRIQGAALSLLMLIGALTGSLVAAGAAHAGDVPDHRIHGERVPGVGVRLSFAEQTCLVTRPGECRSWLRGVVATIRAEDGGQGGHLAFHGQFPRVRLAGLNLAGIDFSQARLRRADFRGANLQGANFTGTDLRGARFSPRPKPTAVNVRTSKCQTVGDVAIYCDQAKLSGTKFYRADLRGVDFSHAVMSQVQMTDTLAQGANFTLVDLQRSVITRTTFDGAIFDSTLLRSASIGDSSFTDARMYKALFYGTMLTESDFTGADLTKANFKGSLLRGNDFTDAVFSSTTCPDYTKTDTGCAQEG